MFRVAFVGCLAWCALSPSLSAQEATLLLKIKYNFVGRAMKVTEVDPNGPAARLSNDQFASAKLDVGDVIVAIDGIPIGNRPDFTRAMNRSVDGYVRLSVRDVNKSEVTDWWTFAVPSATEPYRAAMDSCARAINAQAVLTPNFSFHINGEYITNTLGMAINPGENMPSQEGEASAEAALRNLMVGFLVVKQNELFRSVVGDQILVDCDNRLRTCFTRFGQSDQVEQRKKIVSEAAEEISELLDARVADWARQHGKKFAVEATLPELVHFRVSNPVSGSTVQILAVADQMLTLCTLRPPNRLHEPLTAKELEIINNSARWTSLPDEDAGAYGHYYYRFVNGSASSPLDQFSQRRSIVITPTTVKNGVVAFKP